VTRRVLFVIASVGAIAMAGVATVPVRSYARGLSFVIRAAGMHGALRRAADIEAVAVRTDDLAIQIPGASLRGRLYRPADPPRRAVLLTSGLHPAGIDEPRLVGLATELAASGLAVVTPDIPELSRFEITPRITDEIDGAAAWLAAHDPSGGGGRIGMAGISFSGGLSIVAAGRQSLRDRVAYVLAFGGHDDLPRVLHYLCTGVDGSEHRPPHDYGVAVILLNIADRLVPPEQVQPLREAVSDYLWASHLDRVDKPAADRQFTALRAAAAAMPEPSATLLRDVNDRNVADLGPRLLPYVDAYGNAAALSPSRSPKPSAEIFLLHGADDNVIPEIESEDLAADVAQAAPVRLLVSGLISHAEADQPVHIGDVVRLAAFWGELVSK
jgi:dienelactone hydrolase